MRHEIKVKKETERAVDSYLHNKLKINKLEKPEFLVPQRPIIQSQHW